MDLVGFREKVACCVGKVPRQRLHAAPQKSAPRIDALLEAQAGEGMVEHAHFLAHPGPNEVLSDTFLLRWHKRLSPLAGMSRCEG